MSFPVTTLGEVVSFKGGGTPSRAEPAYWGGDIPWATVKDLNGGYAIRSTQEFITAAGLKNSASNLIPAGTVVIPTRMALGKAVIIENDVAINQDLKAVLPDREIEPRYLLWYFIANASQIASMGKGATVKGVTLDQLRRLNFPLLPLPEQRRIAAILDKAHALRTKRREAITKLDQLIDSVFREFCGSPYGPPVSIDKPSQLDANQYVPLLSVARLATGHTPSRGIAEYWGGDIPWINLSDIRRLDGKIAMNTEQHATAKGISNSSAVILPKDTVCLSRTASVGFATILGRQMATSQDFVNWICSERINPFYLLAAFRASKQYLVAKSTGSTHKTIYFPVAKRFHIHLPSLSEQARFSELLKLAWRQKDAAEQQVTAADRLFNSLQQAAFSARL